MITILAPAPMPAAPPPPPAPALASMSMLSAALMVTAPMACPTLPLAVRLRVTTVVVVFPPEALVAVLELWVWSGVTGAVSPAVVRYIPATVMLFSSVTSAMPAMPAPPPTAPLITRLFMALVVVALMSRLPPASCRVVVLLLAAGSPTHALVVLLAIPTTKLTAPPADAPMAPAPATAL